MTFKVAVEGFRDGGAIPAKHTCEGEDVSPIVVWENAPAKTKSFALIVDDPDAPVGTWNHWLLWDLPATLTKLNEGAAEGVSGTNDFGRPGYGGPCPPRGHGPHRYFFRLYALDVDSLGAQPNASRLDLESAMEGHILAEAQYMGKYERR